MVREWTLLLKEEGFLPEKALVAVKALVREAIAPHIFRYDSGDPADDVRRALVADASQCCIDAYFNRAPETPERSCRVRAEPQVNTRL